MSPLSNYCENTNLTPTNTCVYMLSSKLDILQFKMLFSANTQKKKPTTQTSGYFITIIISPSSVYSLNNPATFLFTTVMPFFNIRWVETEINAAQYLLACGSKYTFTECGEGAKWGRNGQYTRRHCPEKLWNPYPLRISRFNKFHSNLT